jgi:hypothetical protein
LRDASGPGACARTASGTVDSASPMDITRSRGQSGAHDGLAADLLATRQARSILGRRVQRGARTGRRPGRRPFPLLLSSATRTSAGSAPTWRCSRSRVTRSGGRPGAVLRSWRARRFVPVARCRCRWTAADARGAPHHRLPQRSPRQTNAAPPVAAADEAIVLGLA